jgi:hypothetical protein
MFTDKSNTKLSFVLLTVLAVGAFYVPVASTPLEWVETFFHEISHGLMALATGGEISRVELHIDGSGLCYTSGGWAFLVSFSGYSGAVLWGALLYRVVGATNQHLARFLVAILGILVLVSGILWVRDLVTTFIFAVILVMIIAAHAVGRFQLTQWVVRFIALYVMLSAARTPLYLLDGRSRGDGEALASMTYVPEILWVLIWEVIALWALWTVYRSHDRTTRLATPMGAA